MKQFEIGPIGEKVYHILDEGQSSFYVIEGEEKAAVIDTGITAGEKILPVIRGLTAKPLLLIVTHAHPDHLYHMDEFDEVYLCHRELELPQDILRGMCCAGKDLDLEGTTDIRTGSVIDIGRVQLEICELPGHTPGSVLVLDRFHQMLFTGDAIGSGCGVWMQLNTATGLDEYYEALVKAMKWLVERGGRMTFWGGHHPQEKESLCMPGFNPLNLGLLADLIDLVDKVRKKEITGTPSDAGEQLAKGPVFYASYGRAELIYAETK